ncbi:GNAT family N-acetyltransferase [Aestuariivivens marinum]|uniref:GNAT family N-acetyltransferase n=1 Tax=Aestuariivivens marinum TaxID=2913555 RepID=UPI001F5ADD83|nr:GNAT family N-acetyltransferase [Aestuariivivens marinum]
MFILETKRLFLREFLLSDAAFLFELNQNPKVLKYTGDVPFASLDEAKNFIKNYTDYSKFGVGRWIMIEKQSYKAIGWCGLKNHNKHFIDLGFRLLESYWNLGYATEAAKACIDYGFSKLNYTEIIGRTMKANFASQKVLEKLGFQYSHIEQVDGLHEAMIYTQQNDKK